MELRRRWLLLPIVLLLACLALATAYFLFSRRTSFFAVPTPTAEPTATVTPLSPTATPEPTPTATPEPTPTAVAPTPTPEPTVGSGALQDVIVNTLDNEAGFASYQFDFAYHFVGTDPANQPVDQTASATYLFSNDPSGSSMAIAVSGVPGTEQFNQVNLIELGGSNYMVLPDMGCLAGMAGMAALMNPFIEMVSPDKVLGDLSQAERVMPDEEINGILTQHYLFDETLLAPETGQFDTAEGHLYIAAEGNYIVKMVLDGEGEVVSLDRSGLQNGRLHVEYLLSRIDEPIEIILPEGCGS